MIQFKLTFAIMKLAVDPHLQFLIFLKLLKWGSYSQLIRDNYGRMK